MHCQEERKSGNKGRARRSQRTSRVAIRYSLIEVAIVIPSMPAMKIHMIWKNCLIRCYRLLRNRYIYNVSKLSDLKNTIILDSGTTNHAVCKDTLFVDAITVSDK